MYIKLYTHKNSFIQGLWPQYRFLALVEWDTKEVGGRCSGEFAIFFVYMIGVLLEEWTDGPVV